jgi:hypothetical protein
MCSTLKLKCALLELHKESSDDYSHCSTNAIAYTLPLYRALYVCITVPVGPAPPATLAPVAVVVVSTPVSTPVPAAATDAPVTVTVVPVQPPVAGGGSVAIVPTSAITAQVAATTTGAHIFCCCPFTPYVQA